MTFSRILAVGILGLGLILNSGCGSSSPASNGSGTTVTTTGACSNPSTTNETCIPSLVSPVVDFQGKITVTNAGLLANILKNDPLQVQQSLSYITNNTYIDIYLQDSGTGPGINITVLLGSLPPGTLPIQNPGFPYSNIIAGDSTFTLGTSNPAAGVMELDVGGLSIVDPIDINSLTQLWDGSRDYLTALSVTIGAAIPPATAPIFGNVGLIRVQ